MISATLLEKILPSFYEISSADHVLTVLKSLADSSQGDADLLDLMEDDTNLMLVTANLDLVVQPERDTDDESVR